MMQGNTQYDGLTFNSQSDWPEVEVYDRNLGVRH